MGFRAGKASPCVFYLRERGLRGYIHGDDFVVVGMPNELKWLQGRLEQEYELTVEFLGPDGDQTKEGAEYEADPRQVERLLEEIDLVGEGVKGVGTPSVKPLPHQVAEEKELPESEHTKFRGLAARANYLAADRVDIIYPAKEICRFMAAPSSTAMRAICLLYTSPSPRDKRQSAVASGG